MAGPAVEIAKRYLEALFEEDHDAAFQLLHPDVEAVSPRRTTRGAEQVRARWGKADYDHLAPEVDRREFAESDGVIHATTHMTWRWKDSGEIAYRTRVDGDFVVEDGLITRIETAVEHKAAA